MELGRSARGLPEKSGRTALASKLQQGGGGGGGIFELEEPHQNNHGAKEKRKVGLERVELGVRVRVRERAGVKGSGKGLGSGVQGF